jgi:16S rRNA processing protein RimM
MLKKENLVFLGTLIKPHGIHGDMILKLTSLHPEDLPEMESIFVEIEGLIVPFFISHYSDMSESSLLIGLADIKSNDDAKSLTGCIVYITKNKLDIPDNLHLKSQEIISFDIIDRNHGNIGKITDFLNIKDNPLLKVAGKGKEFMIPFHSDMILKIDRNKKTVITEIPEGLLD